MTKLRAFGRDAQMRGYAAALPHIRAAIKAYRHAIRHRPCPPPSGTERADQRTRDVFAEIAENAVVRAVEADCLSKHPAAFQRMRNAVLDALHFAEEHEDLVVPEPLAFPPSPEPLIAGEEPPR